MSELLSTFLASALWLERAGRFLSLEDPFVRATLLGAVLLGINCGLLGSFLVVRRMALVGDTLSHAVLPGIVGGYIWNYSKDPMSMLVGAIIAGVVGSMLIHAITSTSKLKADAAQGIILTVFFALGVCLISMLPQGNKSGVDKFLFGQLAAVSSQDIALLWKSTGLTLLVVFVFYRGLLVLSFDPVFGKLSGLPIRLLHYILMLLTTLGIVVAMEAVGVVLVSALLVIPAASASLLTDKLPRILGWSACFGVGSALAGSFFSFIGEKLAAGPMVVICSAAIFAMCFLFSPRQGLFTKWIGHRRWSRRVHEENELKAIYRGLENRNAAVSAPFTAEEIAISRGMKLSRLLADWAPLIGGHLIRNKSLDVLNPAGKSASTDGAALFQLTEAGQLAAQRVVRHHRLWELYLARQASYAADHVHEDAEQMEHLMSDEQAARLFDLLGQPKEDPHGKVIP